ncbi:class I SAM-dependent methyltransferase [Dactylosporangium sp. CA-139114]|uniref:class I SAM-dependent methyltransferase n=1 Tax=unclassified Dactylosporangium TaxID=2621675 RepID=UPI003D8EB9F6
MLNAVLARVSRLLRTPVERYIRPNPRINSIVWDLQYKLGFWRYLDRLSDGEMPLALVETWAPHPTILDLGCGSSANMPLPAGRYRHYHGVDVSRAAIAQARRLGRPHTSFEVADIRTFTTAERYDAILLREVLYYLTPQEARDLLLRLPGLLSDRGRVVVQIHSVEQARDVVELVRGCGVPVDREVPARLGDGPSGAFLVLKAPVVKA